MLPGALTYQYASFVDEPVHRSPGSLKGIPVSVTPLSLHDSGLSSFVRISRAGQMGKAGVKAGDAALGGYSVCHLGSWARARGLIASFRCGKL